LSHPQILLDDEIRIGEVLFFTVLCLGDSEVPVALVSLFSQPDPTLLCISVNTLWSCEYQGDSALAFIDVKHIQAVVAMVPYAPAIEGQEARQQFFLVEKPGLDVAVLAGAEEDFIGGNPDGHPEPTAV